MRRLVVLGMVMCMHPVASGQLIQTFQLDTPTTGTLAGDTFTLTLPALIADGVTFDATVTVTGTAQGGGSGTLTQSSDGLGVAGAGSDLVSDGESLTFAMSVFNFVGGTVNFGGFTEIDFNFFGATDSGVLSLDNSEATVGDNFVTTSIGANVEDISGFSPITFSAIASAGAPNTFRVDDVAGQFSGTPVPEPSAFLALGFTASAALLVGFCRRHRNRPQP